MIRPKTKTAWYSADVIFKTFVFWSKRIYLPADTSLSLSVLSVTAPGGRKDTHCKQKQSEHCFLCFGSFRIENWNHALSLQRNMLFLKQSLRRSFCPHGVPRHQELTQWYVTDCASPVVQFCFVFFQSWKTNHRRVSGRLADLGIRENDDGFRV